MSLVIILVNTLTHTHAHTHTQVGFWDPRSDDDQMMVMALHFNGDQLVVGFQGGIALLFHINNQSANINIQVGERDCRVM